MQRRDVLMAAGGVAAAWPCLVRAQLSGMPVIGFLSGLAAPDRTRIVTPFLQGLNATGYTEGRNLGIEYRFAEAHYERLPAIAVDLVRQGVTAIAAISGTPAALAAKAATATVPIVFAIGGDPVVSGLVTRLDRPGGNVTGVTFFTSPRLDLLRELVPTVRAVAVLVNPANPQLEGTNAETAAQAQGLHVGLFNADDEAHIDEAFTEVVSGGFDALIVSADPLFFNTRGPIIALCARHSIPASYADREYAELGGLFSYGASRSEAYRQAGLYVGRILNGEKAGDLPVVLPSRFEFAINLTTARALGLTVPFALQARADEVIE